MTTNLLPLQTKQILRNEYRLRVSVVVLFLLAVAFAGLVVLRVPVYFFAKERNAFVVKTLEDVRTKGGTQEYRDLTKQVEELNAHIALVTKAHNETQPSLALEHLLSRRLPGMVFHEFKYSQAGGRILLEVRGRTPTRDTLLAYVDALKGDGLFPDVHVPVSNFVRDKDAEFSITVVVAPTL